jgi:hypothetical protein
MLSQAMQVCRLLARAALLSAFCSPKPQKGCCRTRSYTCVHSLAACVSGTSDTCPVVLDTRREPTTPPIHHSPILDPTGYSVCSSPYVDSSFAASHRPSHNITLYVLTQPLQQSSPPPDACLDRLRRDETQFVPSAPLTWITVSSGCSRRLLTPPATRQTA